MRAARYDLQVHTDASPCSGATPEDVVDASLAADLGGIAITNHDTLEGVDEATHHAPNRLDVIPGVEVTTTHGHLLALDVDAVPDGHGPRKVIESIHDMGGVAVLSHPFDRLRQYFDADLPEIAAAADGVEVTNSRCLRPAYNRQARRFADQYGLATTGGSDAHFPHEVGRAVTTCTGPLVPALRRGETDVEGRGGYVSGHVATKTHEYLGIP